MEIEIMNNIVNADMQQLLHYMEDNGYTYEDECGSTMYFTKICNDEEWVFSLTEPHSGNKFRWMLRAENHKDFDRWSNASYEEFYTNKDDFIKHALIDLEKK